MDSSKVSFGKPKATGAVFVAPAGTELPTDATTPLAEAFKNLGYISEDGLVESIETDTTDITAWGGDTVLSGQSSFSATYTVNLLETSVEVMKLIYGDGNVTDKSGALSAVKVTADELDRHVVVFELALTGGRVERIVLPAAQIVDRSGEVNYTDGEAIIYPAAFKAYPVEHTYATKYFAQTA